MNQGYATGEGTSRYSARFRALASNGFFREAGGVTVSSLGIGTYLGRPDDAADAAYTEAAVAAARAASTSSIRPSTTAISVPSAGGARGARSGISSAKRRWLHQGRIPDPRRRPGPLDGRRGGRHAFDGPLFLSDQIERSRSNLGLDTIDVFYVHNPETQLGFRKRDEFEDRIRRAFARLERLAEKQKIRTTAWPPGTASARRTR